MRVVRASELGEHAFCQRAWYLQRVLGKPTRHGPALAAGTAAHARHGAAVRAVAGLRALALFLFFIALLTLAAALWS